MYNIFKFVLILLDKITLFLQNDFAFLHNKKINPTEIKNIIQLI